VVYLPVKFRRGSVHFPRRYSPRNPDVHLISHYGVRIFSGSFLRYCCRSPLCPALRTASPRVPMHCLAHLPSLLPQSPWFLVSAFSSSVLHQGRTLVILGLCHDRVTPGDSARPLDCCRLKSDRDRTPPTLRIHLRSNN